MADWITARLPTSTDADIHGMVRWGPQLPGMLISWQDVRVGEAWSRSAAWHPKPEHYGHGH